MSRYSIRELADAANVFALQKRGHADNIASLARRGKRTMVEADHAERDAEVMDAIAEFVQRAAREDAA